MASEYRGVHNGSTKAVWHAWKRSNIVAVQVSGYKNYEKFDFSMDGKTPKTGVNGIRLLDAPFLADHAVLCGGTTWSCSPSKSSQ